MLENIPTLRVERHLHKMLAIPLPGRLLSPSHSTRSHYQGLTCDEFSFSTALFCGSGCSGLVTGDAFYSPSVSLTQISEYGCVSFLLL